MEIVGTHDLADIAGNDIAVVVGDIDVAVFRDDVVVGVVDLALVDADHQVAGDPTLRVRHRAGGHKAVQPQGAVVKAGHVDNVASGLVQVAVPDADGGVDVIIVLRHLHRAVAHPVGREVDHVIFQVDLVKGELILPGQAVHIIGKLRPGLVVQRKGAAAEPGIVVIQIGNGVGAAFDILHTAAHLAEHVRTVGADGVQQGAAEDPVGADGDQKDHNNAGADHLQRRDDADAFQFFLHSAVVCIHGAAFLSCR